MKNLSGTQTLANLMKAFAGESQARNRYTMYARAAAGENAEWTELYPAFADVAASEGFPEVASAFRLIGRAEEAHEKRYSKLVANLENGAVFKKNDRVFWKCRNCGYIHEGAAAPKTCPACLVDQGYFEASVENY